MSKPLPLSLVNGSDTGCIDAVDRGHAYGDGVFETIAVHATGPRFWNRHMARLQSGCHRLGIAAVDEAVLRKECDSLLERVAGDRNYVLKIIVTRGAGGRGYRPNTSTPPTRILQLHDWPELPPVPNGIRATLCSLRLGNNPQLAGIKHLNRLEQVLARAEWSDPEIREGLMLDQGGRVIEGTMSNLFLVKNSVLHTPDLTRCGVAGIMRNIVLEIANEQDYATKVSDITLNEIFMADELFVCNSLIGIWPITGLDSNRYSIGPVTTGLQTYLQVFDNDKHEWRA
jgi:4-amino-4-deoxychorismate lyase